MIYLGISVIFIALICIIRIFQNKLENSLLPIACIIVIIINGIIISIDYKVQTNCTEIWSGKIIKVKHIEEWDEWIQEQGHTDNKGKYIVDIQAHWEHHDAENYITTSDNGSTYVSNTPDGNRFTDYFVNSDDELAMYYPIGTPTSSTHTYQNKVQASDSIYKTRDIDLKQYPNLPKYPEKNENLSIQRFIGEIDNKKEVLKEIDKINTTLNDTSNPNNEEGTKSYKQVNVIFVNLGDVTEDYAYALQNVWKNGNKNDFIIAFGVDSNNKVSWCQPITWSEVESLKTDVRNYMLDKSNLSNFVSTVDDIGDIVEKQFVRKEFSDFNYINIEVSGAAKLFIVLFTLIESLAIIFRDRIEL